MRLRLLATPLGVLACLWLANSGCDPEDPPSAPPENLLLISIDTLRADHLGAYGYTRATSPNLDALAARGTLFERAMSTSSWTLPAHASLLTGLYPAEHRVADDGVRLGLDVPTLAERLRDTGMYAFAVVSHVYVAKPFGLDRGFDLFDDSLIEGGATNPRGDVVVERFLALLDGRPAGPFFGFIHFFDPHWDYTPPPPYDQRFAAPGYAGPIDGTFGAMRSYLTARAPIPAEDLRAIVDRYDGEIAFLDAEIGRLFEALEQRGLLGRTAIVVTADHGEEFKEHRRLGHGSTLFEEQLHVPLVFAGHPAFATSRHKEPVSLVDVAPTLIEMFGGKPLEGAPGISLVGRAKRVDRVLFAETIRTGLDLRAARLGPHKRIEILTSGRERFFDLDRDPGERDALRRDPTEGRLTAALDAFGATADAGGHMKLVARGDEPLWLSAEISSTARILDPRHYASSWIAGAEAEFVRFELSEDAHRLAIDVRVSRHMATVRFETQPADAPLAITLRALTGGALFVGGELVAGSIGGDAASAPARREIALLYSDPALARPFPGLADLAAGVHLRLAPPVPRAPPAPELSPAARRRLEALGYAEEPSDNP